MGRAVTRATKSTSANSWHCNPPRLQRVALACCVLPLPVLQYADTMRARTRVLLSLRVTMVMTDQAEVLDLQMQLFFRI